MNPSGDRPTLPASATNLELLRRYEPVVRYTKGEQFYPTDVERYIDESSLWAHYPDGRDELLVKQKDLVLESLVEQRPAPFGTVHYMRFIENLSLSEAAKVLADQQRLRRILKNRFHAGIGRLARGGLLPRVVDALFSLSFLLRGKVPEATAAAAELDYFHMRTKKENYIYYGRVARQNGWTILQYWFFYCYNSWRSGFGGVNDHESDWEMISVYLYEDDGQLIPEWAAYASHDFHGDDLRRRWDDQDQLDLADGHPVVYAGAGSHASYFRKGEYQDEVNLNVPSWLSNIHQVWSKIWTQVLDQEGFNPFRIPFVDYARADGLNIGPGQSKTWTPVVIDETTPWVSQYRGLWGLYARDPISGENAPAGPMYNRDGSPRGSWYDPLGFAGLDKIPPPPDALRLLQENCSDLTARQTVLAKLIPEKGGDLQEMGTELKAMENNPHLAKQHAALQRKLAALAEEVRGLRREYSENTTLLESLTSRLVRMWQGVKDEPRVHIHRLTMPVQGARMRFDRAAEAWAAISLSLLLFVIVILIFFAGHFLAVSLAVMLLLFIVTESVMRGAFVQTISELSAVLATVAAIILVIHFWKWILVTALLAVAIFLLSQRFRELTGR